MEIIYYFLIIIITIIAIIALRKLSKSKKTNIKYDSFSKIKNDSFENNFNNYANNENKENSYYYQNEKKLFSNQNKIKNQNLSNKQKYIITKDYYIPYLAHNDKEIYYYLYQLPFIKNRIIILDTEVAGISSLDHIIELCALEMINGKLTSKYYHSFFNPKKKINQSMIKKHKIPKNVLKYSYKREKNIFEGFLNFINNSIIITHNAVFDMEKINYELNYYNLPLINKFKFRCSMRIFLDKYRNVSNKFSKLKECCDFLNIKYINENLHLAYYDAFLLGKIMEKIYEKEYILNSNIKNIQDNNNNLLNIIDNYNFYDDVPRINNDDYQKGKGIYKNTSFEKFVDDNIDEIYKQLEDEEIDKIFENILNEKETENSFSNFTNENIDDIFDYLKKEEIKKIK